MSELDANLQTHVFMEKEISKERMNVKDLLQMLFQVSRGVL